MAKIADHDFANHIATHLAVELAIDKNRLLVFGNSAKYGTSIETTAHNQRVFERLREINLVGMTTEDLCRRVDGQGRSFRECIDHTSEVLADRAAGRDVIYVELGPEPVKTGSIIPILRTKVRSLTYVGIDINAASEAVMRDEITPLTGAATFHYLVRDYHDVSRRDIATVIGRELDESLVIVTSLGSQEGNEHPHVIHGIYRRLIKPGDLLLSELQLLPLTNHAPIFEFSHHPLWRDVSRAFREKVFGDTPSEYGTVLVPIRIDGVGQVRCAIAVERLLKPGASGDILISNYCLKYTEAQLTNVRGALGFEIVEDCVSGDGSVTFQVLTPALPE